MTFINLNLAHPVVRTDETTTGQLVAMGARFVMDGRDSDGRFGLIDHPIIPRGLAAPLHLHGLEMDFDSIEDLIATHGLVAAATEATAAY